MTLEQFDFTEIEQMMDKIFTTRQFGFADMVGKIINGDVDLSLKLIGDMVNEQLWYEIQTSKNGMIHILILLLVAAVFANFSGMFQNLQAAEIGGTMLYMMLITICLNHFRILLDSAVQQVGQLLTFMETLGPIYFLAVTIATGSVTSVAFYQIVLILIYLVEVIIIHFLLPLTQIYLVVRILNEFSKEIQLSKFAEFMELMVSWSLKILSAGIIGFNVIQRILSPAIDSVKRGALIHGGGAIPFLGDVIGGGAEIVLGTAVLIKNGIGIVGMIICLMICAIPLVQMGINAMMYLLVSALMQPISDKRMVNCVSCMADGCKLILKIIFTTGILFLLTIAVVATTAGGI